MERKRALICPSFERLPVLDSGLDLSLGLNVYVFPAHGGAVVLRPVFNVKAVLPHVSFPVMSPAFLCVPQLERDLFAVERTKSGAPSRAA